MKASILLIAGMLFLGLAGAVQPVKALETTCNSCGDCSAKLDGTYSKVTLANDIVNVAGDCVIFNSNNVIFDCDNFLIGGDTITFGYGISMYSKSGNTIQNCKIQDYSEQDSAAILLFSSMDNTLSNNILRFNRKGIWLDANSNNNIIKSNTLRDNDIGIQTNSNNNLMYNNNIFNNPTPATDTGTNSWHNGYITGGNYWGGGCIDNFRGAGQNKDGSDGICDAPFVIDPDSQDNFSFVSQSGWLLNRPPVLDAVNNVTVTEGQTVEITASAIDPNNDTLTYSINPPGNFSQNGNVFTWATDFDDSGVYEFNLTASDGSLTDSTMFSVTVQNFNQAPIITGINAPKRASISHQINFTVNAFDPDNDPLTYSINNTKGGAITHNGPTFNWTPTSADWGMNNFIITVSDGTVQTTAPLSIDVYFCGDANHDKKVNLIDIIVLVNYIFKGGPAPNPMVSGDVNSDGKVNLNDIVYLVNYIFKGGPAPDCSRSPLNSV